MPKLTALQRISTETGVHEVGSTFNASAAEAQRLVFLGFAAPAKEKKRKARKEED